MGIPGLSATHEAHLIRSKSMGQPCLQLHSCMDESSVISKLAFSVDWHFYLYSENWSKCHLELVGTETNVRSKTGISFGERWEMTQIHHKWLSLDTFVYGLHRGSTKPPGKCNTNKNRNSGLFLAFIQWESIILNRSVKPWSCHRGLFIIRSLQI